MNLPRADGQGGLLEENLVKGNEVDFGTPKFYIPNSEGEEILRIDISEEDMTVKISEEEIEELKETGQVILTTFQPVASEELKIEIEKADKSE